MTPPPRHLCLSLQALRFVLLAAAALTLAYIWLTWSERNSVREDEMLHLHNVWRVGQGDLPYRDFFEHHAPWYHFLAAPFSLHFAPEQDSESARDFVVFMRRTSLATVLAGLALLVLLGSRWKGVWHGFLALALLTGTPFFLETAIEVRPDILAFALWMGALLVLRPILADSRAPDPRWIRCPFLWAGLMLGSAAMLTQKILFALPGLVPVLGIWAAFHWRSASGGLRFLRFALGGLLPTAATWLYFQIHGAGMLFIDRVFLINTRWVEEPFKNDWILKELFLPDSKWLLAAGALGAYFCLLRMLIDRKADWLGLAMIASAAGWFAGHLWIIPVIDRQFYMVSLPLIALLGAHGILEALRICMAVLASMFRGLFASEDPEPEPVPEEAQPSWAKLDLDHPILRGVAGVAGLAAAGFLIQEPLESSSRSLAHKAHSGHCMHRTMWVADNTRPGDMFMESFTGAGPFRPRGWHYGFVHSEIPEMIPLEEVDELILSLMEGKVRPVIIPEDFIEKLHLRLHHPGFSQWLEEGYRFQHYPFRHWRLDGSEPGRLREEEGGPLERRSLPRLGAEP